MSRTFHKSNRNLDEEPINKYHHNDLPGSKRCGATRKVIFKTHEDALMRGAEILENKGNRNSTPATFRAYQCEFCGKYHLTGKVAETWASQLK